MESEHPQIIIFCQAPSDVQYVLSLYEEFHGKNPIRLFVVNVEGIYNYFKALELDLEELKFIPFPKDVPLKNFKKLNKIKDQIYSDYNSNFKDLQNNRVYFFSRFFDWVTAFNISRISEKNTVFLIEYQGEKLPGSRKSTDPINIYRKIIYKYLTSISFRFLQLQSQRIMVFPIEKYNICKLQYQADTNIISKYRVSFPTENKKTILLFENNQSTYDFYSDYESEMTAIVELFKKFGFKIFLKPHPRIGYSDFLKPYADYIVPAGISGEFLNSDDFTLIAGSDTTAISYFAKLYPQKTISLLDLFKFKREDEKIRFRQMIIDHSEGKLRSVNSYNELEQILTNL